MPEYATNKLATVGTTREKIGAPTEDMSKAVIPEETITILKKYSSLSIKDNTDAQYALIDEILKRIRRLIYFVDRNNAGSDLGVYDGNRPGTSLKEDIAWNSVELEFIENNIRKLAEAIGEYDIVV